MLFPPARARRRCGLALLTAAAAWPLLAMPAASAQTAVSTFSVAASGRSQPIAGFGTAVFSADDGIDSDRDWYDYDAFARSFADDLGANILRIELSHQAVALRNPSTSRFDLDYTTPVAFDTFHTVDPEDPGQTLGAAALANNIQRFDFDSYRTRVGVRAAQAVAPVVGDDFKLIGTLWTPPHWMKGNRVDQFTGERLPDGNANTPYLTPAGDSVGGSIRGDAETLEQFGEYVAAYVRGLETVEGVKLDYLSIQNEPSLFAGFISSHLSNPGLYVAALQEVDRAFDHYGITTQIVAAESIGIGSRFDRARDVNGTVVVDRDVKDPQRDDAALNVQAEILEAIWAAEVESGERLIDGYATHGVDGRNRGPLRGGDLQVNPTGAWDRYLGGYTGGNKNDPDDFNRNTFAGLNNDPLGRAGALNWQTETSGDPHRWTGDTDVGEAPYPPNFGSALSQAVGLHHALADGNVNAYLYWQLSFSANDLQQEREVLLKVGADQDYAAAARGTDAKKFAAARHYSRFVRPGMVRYELDLALAADAGRGATADDYFRGDLLGSLFVDEATDDFSLVFINTFAEARDIALDLSALSTEYGVDLSELVLAGVATDHIATFERLADLIVSDGVVTLTLAPESLVSLTTNAALIPEPATAVLLAGLALLAPRRVSRLVSRRRR